MSGLRGDPAQPRVVTIAPRKRGHVPRVWLSQAEGLGRVDLLPRALEVGGVRLSADPRKVRKVSPPSVVSPVHPSGWHSHRLVPALAGSRGRESFCLRAQIPASSRSEG